MLYYDFKDYEGFKELFGIVEHGNGVKSRKNKILLSLYKNKPCLHNHRLSKEFKGLLDTYNHVDDRYGRILDSNHASSARNCEKVRRMRRIFFRRLDHYEGDIDFLKAQTMPSLKNAIFNAIRYGSFHKPGCTRHLKLMDFDFSSDTFETDNLDGLCEDGTLNAIRYRSIEKGKVFKMKAGKMFNHIMSCYKFFDIMPEQVKRWLSEEFVADWVEYARKNIGEVEYKLHVDDNFSDIYDSDKCAGYNNDSNSFGSCMVDDGQWTFYRDAVKAKAAYLTDSEGMIVARCIVFTEVYEEGSDRIWRLAERQYSKEGRPELQRQLVCALIREGYIDGYKRVGASCQDARGFLDNNGESLERKRFWITCDLDDGDTLSYQDSFKSYDYESRTANNYNECGIRLDTTNDTVSFRVTHWSDYNQEDIDEDDAVYVETRDDYFYSNQTIEASVLRGRNYVTEDCFEEDCIEIDGDYYYAGIDRECPSNYGIHRCDYCDEYFLEDNEVYSELTDGHYCCDSCRETHEEEWHEENGDVYSEYDDGWYDQDYVLTAKMYSFGHYEDITIYVDTFNDLVDDGRATVFLDEYYIDEVNLDGEPAHAGAIVRVA